MRAKISILGEDEDESYISCRRCGRWGGIFLPES